MYINMYISHMLQLLLYNRANHILLQTMNCSKLRRFCDTHSFFRDHESNCATLLSLVKPTRGVYTNKMIRLSMHCIGHHRLEAQQSKGMGLLRVRGEGC